MIKRSEKRANAAWPVTLMLLGPSLAVGGAADMSFNWDIISREMGVDMDPEMFAEMQREMAIGLHPYDIYVNNTSAGEQTVEIYESEVDPSSLLVALPAVVFQKLPLKEEALEKLFELDPHEMIRDYDAYIPGVVVELDEGFQFVRVKIPQIYEDTRKRTYMPSSVWNYGEPALKFRYNADVSYRDPKAGEESSRGFLSGDLQLNLGRWRLKAQGTASKESGELWTHEFYDRHATTLVPSLEAEFRVGEFNTRSSYMTGLPIIGLNLYEDGNQLEPIEREYLPVISGIANSSAVVTVRQDGRVLRETDVSAGPFEFSDIRTIGSSGDIEVEVKEYSGKTSVFIVPYSSDQKLLKDGRFTWSVALGRYYEKAASEHPWVMEASGGYGMPVGGWTLFGGTIQSDIFQQYLLGSAFDVGHWGSVALQLEESRISRGEKRSGRVAELSWSKYFELSESDFDFRYRHTMEGDLGSISEALMQSDIADHGITLRPEDFVKDEVSVSLSKTIGRWGSFSGSAFWQETQQGNRTETLNAAWSFDLFGCPSQLQAQGSRQKTVDFGDSKDWTLSLRVDIPLAKFGLLTSSPFNKVSVNSSRRSHGDYSRQVDFTTKLDEDNDWEWNFALRDNRYAPTQFDTNLRYSGSMGSMSINGGYSEDAKSVGMNVSGGMLATTKGIHLTNSMVGNTVVVHVPDAKTAKVKSSKETGEWLVLTGFSDFVSNPVTLDPDSLPPNLTVIGGYEKEIIPANEAVITVEFPTFVGEQAVFTIRKLSGEPLPYGALVSVLDVPVMLEPAVTDEGGQAYFTSVPKAGTLEAKWRDDDGVQSCRIPYELSGELEDAFDIYQEEVVCQREGEKPLTTEDEALYEDIDESLEQDFMLEADDEGLDYLVHPDPQHGNGETEAGEAEVNVEAIP